MVDIREKNKDRASASQDRLVVVDALPKMGTGNSQNSQASISALDAPIEDSSDKKSAKKPTHVKSGGEVLFDRSVYTGIGFVVNEAGSMVIADELRYGSNKYFGKQLFNKAADLWTKLFKLENKIGKNGKNILAKARAENTLEVGALLVGGTLLVVPMKWLEDHKSELVKKANHFLDKLRGNKLDAEEVQNRDQQVAEDIACQSKQSWTSLIAGRVLAVITNMGILSNTVLTEPVTTGMKDWSEKYVTKATVATDKVLGDKANSLLKKLMSTDRFKRYARILSVETVYTASSSLVLEIASKFIAGRKTLVHDEKLCDETQTRDADKEAAETNALQASAPVPGARRAFTQTISPRKETEREHFASHAEKIAAKPAQQLQPGL